MSICDLVFRGDQPLLLRLEFHPGAQQIDAGDQAVFVEVHIILDKRLGRLHLGADRLHRSHIRNHQEIGVAGGEHHQVAIALIGIL